MSVEQSGVRVHRPTVPSRLPPSGVDVAVLLIFFNRPDQFRCVFEQVRIARPSRLYLYQDGPRPDHAEDRVAIAACRAIASEVDWECEVRSFFQDENHGCDPSGYIAQKWLFEHETMGIVLEDDVVPSQAFFTYCDELLRKYEDDERVDRICGMNNIEVAEHVDTSYFFARTGSIWGWASWKRVLDGWDPDYLWLDDDELLSRLRAAFDTGFHYHEFLARARMHKASGVPHHESIGGFACAANNRLLVVPRSNLITCIGATDNSTHSTSRTETMPRSARRLFGMTRYEIDFPLCHPKYMLRDSVFERAMTRTRAQHYFDALESVVLLVRHGEVSRLQRLVANGLRKRRLLPRRGLFSRDA